MNSMTISYPCYFIYSFPTLY